MLETPNPRNQQVKNYIDSLFSFDDTLLKEILEDSKNKGLSSISVPSHVGKLLYLLAKIQNCSRILEIGTLAGYSTIWLARALHPNGQLISIDINLVHVELAKKNLQNASLTHLVNIFLGDASILLKNMIIDKYEPFDLIFIDADKENLKNYLDLSIQLSKKGTLILIDNLIPRGEEIGHPANHEAEFIYSFNKYLAENNQLETVLVPTIVGTLGRLDCIGICRMKE